MIIHLYFYTLTFCCIYWFNVVYIYSLICWFQGADLDEEEADRIRKIELLRNVEEWDHVLAKSQTIDSSYTSILAKTRVPVTSSDNTLDNTNSSRQNNLKEDTNQKKHCDEKMQKVIQGLRIS